MDGSEAVTLNQLKMWGDEKLSSGGGLSYIKTLKTNESVTVSLNDYSAIVVFVTETSGSYMLIESAIVIPRNLIRALVGRSLDIQLGSRGSQFGTISNITASSARVRSSVWEMRVCGLK